VSTVPDPQPGSAPEEKGAGATVAARISDQLAVGGVLLPVVTTLFAFLIGGLVVLATGKNPFSTYQAIFEGSGLNWLLPWVGGADRDIAAINLQQTLLITGPLILLGFAVAFAFRTGLFNIGGQGQYIAGSVVAVWIGSSDMGVPGWLQIVLAMLGAAIAGGVWGGIAGLLRATTGANEVITTIMLNYTALWVSFYLFGLGGPLQNDSQPDIPVSNDVVPEARLPVFWGDPELQGLHIGIFFALVAAVFFWLLLNRSTKGFEARAVGFNPDAARASGIHVGRTYVFVMATCGLLAGLAGSLDILGWQFRIATNDIQAFELGFLGIAVALLGRNTAIGTCLAGLLFGALVSGTSVRNLDPAVFEPALASNLTGIIQGLVVLFVVADVMVIAVWKRLSGRGRRRAGGAGTAGNAEPEPAA
jgi:simple sugar transport system permease protein